MEKKQKRKFVNTINIARKFLDSSTAYAHFLTVISLVPALVMMWVAIPTFVFDVGDREVTISGIKSNQPEDPESAPVNQIEFRKGLDLQGGVSFMYEVEGDREDDNYQSDLDKTLKIMEERIRAVGLEGQVYLLSDNQSDNILIHLSSTREDITSIPEILGYRGEEVKIWIQDPDYQPPEDEEETLVQNFLEGYKESTLTAEDIAVAYSLNDSAYSRANFGQGQSLFVGYNSLKIDFNGEAQQEFSTVLNQSAGYAGTQLVIDERPVAFSLGADFNRNSLIMKSRSMQLDRSDIFLFQSIAAVINTDSLPLDINTPVSNYNIDSYLGTDISYFKASILVGFILLNIVALFIYRRKGILVVAVNLATTSIGVGALKIFGLTLTSGLIFGAMIPVLIINILMYIFIAHFNKYEEGSVNSMKKESEEMRSRMRNIIFFVIFISAIWEFFQTRLTEQIHLGIGFVSVAAVITLWTVFRTFFNEIYLIPRK